MLVCSNIQHNAEESEFLLSTCNGKAVVRKKLLLKKAPLANFTSEMEFDASFNTTGYRFVNPAGIYFDGICARGDALTSEVGFAPGPPIGTATWFPGYSWRPLFVPGCERRTDGHLGWAFYKDAPTEAEAEAGIEYLGDGEQLVDGEVGDAYRSVPGAPDFVFLILWSSVVDNFIQKQVSLLSGHQFTQFREATSGAANETQRKEGAFQAY